MQKVLVFFCSIMLVMAILVSGGYVKERGFFLVMEDVYAKVTPFIEKTAGDIVDFELGVRSEFSSDEMVALIRVWFNDDGNRYYVDLLATLDPNDPDYSVDNSLGDLNRGSFQIVDSNHPGNLKIWRTIGIFKIYDADERWPRRYIWMYVKPFIYDGQNTRVERAMLSYLEYVTDYRGKAVSLS